MHPFKSILTIPAFCLLVCLIVPTSFAAQPDANKKETPLKTNDELSIQEAQEEMQNALREIISVSGKVLAGMTAGMQEGAQDLQNQLDSLDGTKLIADKKALAEFLHVSVFRVEDRSNGAWRVILAIKNDNTFPVRLTNLTNKQSVLLLDNSGFAYSPISSPDLPRTLTVPARAAVKAVFDFAELEEGKPGTFRLFDVDIPLKSITKL